MSGKDDFMSKTISNNQPTSTVTVTRTVPVPNWNSDFRPSSDKPGDVNLSCISAPLDAPTSVILKSNTVANVYKTSNASVPAEMQSPLKTGVKILNQRNEVWSKSDSTDATYKVSLPVSAHLVLNIPNDDTISVDDVDGLINRMIGGLYEVVDSKGSTRLAAILRQALMPAGL